MKSVSPIGRTSGADRGFSLPEAVGYLVLFALMMGALTYAAAALFKTQAQPQVAVNGQTYALAPSFGDFSQAVNLHAAFSQAADQADSIVVLGGTRSHPALDPTGPSSTLAESFADSSLSAAADSDPFQAYSSWDQRQVNTDQFESYLDAKPDPADFTILTVQGLSQITSITQQRRATATVNGEAVVLYEVTHQTIDWSSGSPVMVPGAATGTTPTYFYRIYYAANEDSWAQRPGASHFWYRTDSAWDRDQEGPSLVVFADPYALAGRDATAQISAGSRFVYFLPPLAMNSLRDNRGLASAAVLVFALVAILILVANFNLNYAVGMSSGAFDTFNSETVEKNGVAQIVKESILAVRETAATDSANSVQTEIQNRLASMNFPAGVGLALNAPAAAVPAHPFFPYGTPAPAAPPAYFAATADARPLAGMGNLFNSLAILGPAADLGRLTYTFARTSAHSPADNRTYTVNADLFSVPLTNVDVVAYGLPASGSIPGTAPAVPGGSFGPGISTLVVTSNNPANDPAAYPDLYAASNPELLPYQFRNAVSFSWNAYEFLWSAAYQNALLAAAGPASIYDFSAANNPAIPGVTVNGNAIAIDCGAVTGQVLAIVDSEGTGQVAINGSAGTGSPFILLLRNTAGAPARTAVTFAGSNNRPAIFYLENAAVSFSGGPQIQGALFLDPTTEAAGAVTWFGHLSFYAAASPLSTLAITMEDSPAVRSALAPIAPRVLLVSTTATR